MADWWPLAAAECRAVLCQGDEVAGSQLLIRRLPQYVVPAELQPLLRCSASCIGAPPAGMRW